LDEIAPRAWYTYQTDEELVELVLDADPLALNELTGRYLVRDPLGSENWEGYVRKTHPKALSLARYFMGGQGGDWREYEVVDAVSFVLMRLPLRAKTYDRARAKVWTWIKTMVRSQLGMARRQAVKRAELLRELPERVAKLEALQAWAVEGQPSGEGVDGDGSVEVAGSGLYKSHANNVEEDEHARAVDEQLARVREIVPSLPEKQRTALIYKHPVLGSQLGAPESGLTDQKIGIEMSENGEPFSASTVSWWIGEAKQKIKKALIPLAETG